MNMVSHLDWDELRDDALAENTSQGILKYLNELESNRERMQTRWIWELLQNARDASAGSNACLIATVEYCPDFVLFRHNGSGFIGREIAHLIHHGSTKVETEEAIGQFGSGFLTTHLLSKDIDVSGRLDTGEPFNFSLKRDTSSVKALHQSMNNSWENFKRSLSTSLTESLPENFTTQFRYPIKGDTAEAVEQGLANLKQCAPFVMAFNEEISRIDIKSCDETICYEVIERIPLSQVGLEEVSVSVTTNGNRKNRVYLLSSSEETAVAIPLEPTNASRVCLPVDDIPRLFLGFPLIGTENFSFPAVINSFRFSPTESRDGVYLGQGNDLSNRYNQDIIQEACELLVNLLRFAAESGWCNTYELADIPAVPDPKGPRKDWIQNTLSDHLIEKIRQTPAVLNEAGIAKSPAESKLPIAETDTGVETLWDLLDGWRENNEVLSRRIESVGWWNAVKSWATILECDVSSLDEAIDGRKLASQVHEVSNDPSVGTTTHRLSYIDDELKERILGINWLDQLIAFLSDNGLSEVIRQCHIVPSQERFLRTLPKLYRDQEIHEELKDIADLLGWRIRCELRDTRLPSLVDEVGKGDRNSDYIVGELIKMLHECAENEIDNGFKEASVRLFTWIVSENKWLLLRGFPVFSSENGTNGPRIIKLERDKEDDERPLVPVKAWSEDLQPYSDLFPRRYIMANAFFEATPNSDIWQMLDEQGFLRKDVIIGKNVYFDTFLPDEPLTDDEEHKTAEQVNVTDVAFITRDDIGIMARVRQSQRLARTFWRFLIEWLIVQDSKGLETNEAPCKCGENHRYYPAEWLVPVVRNMWVPLGERRANQATAKSLSGLFRGNGLETSTLHENCNSAKLLHAIGVRPSELVFEIMASDDPEARATLESTVTDIMVASDGNASNLINAREYIEDLKNDDDLPEVLAKRREQRKIVKKNHQLGRSVENLVKESLEDEGFTVRRKPIGSDFEIEYDLVEEDKEMGIEIARRGRSWLVEVKATRDPNQGVRMTTTQAETAVEKGHEFLLCVVPVDGDAEPELNHVRANMRFVRNIGTRIKPLYHPFKQLRSKTTADESPGVQLEIKSGAARILVARSVWENDGFGLEELAEHLST